MSTEITIQPLTPALRDAYLAYFDGDAFADNAGWAGCYCYFPHADHSRRAWNVRSADENRASAGTFIDAGLMRGYLALVNGRPVGWCNANTRNHFTIFDIDSREQTQVGVIACFVVAQAHRGKGVARSLLNAAVEGFRADGVSLVEAYPLEEAATAAANHYGPLSMYLAAGFEIAGREGENLIVRKQLTGSQ